MSATSVIKLNGYGIPVSTQSRGGAAWEYLGSRSRTTHGGITPHELGDKRVFSFETPPLTPTEALATEHLIKGHGHTFSWDVDRTSSRGLAHSAVDNSLVVSGGKSAGYLSIDSSDNVTFSLTNFKRGGPNGAVLNVEAFTVHKEQSSTWYHYGLIGTSAVGAQYLNGAVHTPSGSDDVDNWADTSGSTSMDLLGKNLAGSNSASKYDHLNIYDWVPTDEMLKAFTAENRINPELPYLEASGNALLQGDTPTVIGEVVDQRFVQASIDGTFYENATVLTFRLYEV